MAGDGKLLLSATPTNKQQVNTALCNATYNDDISPTEAFHKMKKALDIAYTQLDIVSNQVSAMTAAQQRKAALNASKRQVIQLTGEPRMSDVRRHVKLF